MRTTGQGFEIITKAYINDVNFEDAFNELTVGQVIGLYNLFGMKHGFKLHLGFNTVITELTELKEQKRFDFEEKADCNCIINNDTPVVDLLPNSHAMLLKGLIDVIDLDNESQEDESMKFKYIY